MSPWVRACFACGGAVIAALVFWVSTLTPTGSVVDTSLKVVASGFAMGAVLVGALALCEIIAPERSQDVAASDRDSGPSNRPKRAA